VISLSGLQPEGSGQKLYRFLAFGTAISVPVILFYRADAFAGLRALLGAYLLGVGILGVTDAVRVPMELHGGIALFDTGNMRDPQFYMTAILLTVGSGYFLLKGRRGLGWAGMSLYIAGLIFQFKRGAWLATLISLTGLSLIKKKWTIILALFLAAGMALLLPATRERIAQLQNVTELRTGGRYALWTEVAPELVKDYPWGIGFKQSSYKLLREYTPHIQPGLDHLHNNLLQIQVELGWVGLLLWVWIQFSSVQIMLRSILVAGSKQLNGARNMGMALLAAFTGLHINGMVEYNFGDTEILFLYAWIMGMAMALLNHVKTTIGQEADSLYCRSHFRAAVRSGNCSMSCRRKDASRILLRFGPSGIFA
jgi:O-antigen ligase